MRKCSPQPCPACGSGRGHVFYERASTPVLSNALCHDAEAARALPRGSICLVVCTACGLVFNRAFDPEQVDYTSEYESALHFSPTFRSYIHDLAIHLLDQFDLRDRDIIEVGCGDGQFLTLLCRMGGNRGRGYDPAHRRERSTVERGDAVDIVAVPLEQARQSRPADMLVCRHVLEHIADPLPFIRRMRDHLQPGAGVYVEVPDGSYVLGSTSLWDVIYEHCTYFTREPLRRLFARAGFSTAKVYSQYGGQFLCLETRWDPGGSPPSPDGAAVNAVVEQADRFARGQRRLTEYWTERLGSRLARGPTALWGAGSKGSSFLNLLDPDRRSVDVVVDVNPRLHGSFVGGTGHPVVSPDAIGAVAPARVIVANPLYREEVGRILAELGVRPEVLTLGGEHVL